MSLGERLKSERVRLGYNQTDFAKLADKTKKTQVDYEKSTGNPKSSYLTAIAEGDPKIDIAYILTGKRSADYFERYFPTIEKVRKVWDKNPELPEFKAITNHPAFEFIGDLDLSEREIKRLLDLLVAATQENFWKE